MTSEETLPAELERLAEEVDAGGLTSAGVRRRVQERARRRRVRRAVSSGVLLALAATTLGTLDLLERDDGGRQLRTVPAAPTSTAVLGRSGVQAPTLVAPTVVPRGLQFVEGGSSTVVQGHGTVTLTAAGLRRPVELTWWPLRESGGCAELVATGPSPATDSRRSRTHAIGAYLDGTVNQIGWCEPEGTLMVVLFGPDVARQQLADLAMTVSRLPGEPADLTLVAPAGFNVVRDRPQGLRSVLMYGLPGAAWPTLRVEARTAPPDALDRARADQGGELVTVGNRPALIGSDGIRVLYDDHTLVHLRGTAITEQELRRAAESLAPADPSLAPPVGLDPRDGRCGRLGLCG